MDSAPPWGRRLADVGDLLSVADSDKAALLGLYEEKRANLVRFFAARLGSRAEAEDLIQDLYLKISGMETLSPIDNPSALLHRMGQNLMLDRLRSQKRSGTRDNEWRSVNTASLAGQEIADEPAADEVVEDLPEKTRQAFQLHKLDGHSHVETAKRMGISVSTVEKHISSALKTLTRRLR